MRDGPFESPEWGPLRLRRIGEGVRKLVSRRGDRESSRPGLEWVKREVTFVTKGESFDGFGVNNRTNTSFIVPVLYFADRR